MDFSIFALPCISATVAAFCTKKGDNRERTKATGILHVLLGPQGWLGEALPNLGLVCRKCPRAVGPSGKGMGRTSLQF